ncbi:MAG TPA: helix-turn-helix transcriptional regulator [Thermoanaerobaculia bacterium]|nr:helix-turn-helix transcriptional regulator [Thermoanaerobaculia bacterium]
MVRLFRAISGKRQRPFARAANIHPSMLAKYETDETEAPAEVLPPMARQAGLSVADGEDLLRRCEFLQQRRKRAGSGAGDVLAETGRGSARFSPTPTSSC